MSTDAGTGTGTSAEERESVRDSPSDEHSDRPIGAIARELDALPVVNRLRLERENFRSIGLALLVWILGLGILIGFVVPGFSEGSVGTVLGLPPVLGMAPIVVLAAFVFETLDSASGMGFGATIGSLLLILGFDPLAVTPVLLLSEAATGITSGFFHNEFKNVEFGFGSESARETTRALGLIVGLGVAAVVLSVVLAYFAIEVSGVFVQIYIGGVIVLIGVTTIVKKYVDPASEYRPRRLIGFAILAGLNKGITGSGYGPVLTLGEILSGVYEKSATAITSMAEGIVSLAGIAAFFGITAIGIELNLVLLPSVFAGGFLAAIFSPYTVRVLPNKILQYLVPSYALVLAAVLFAQLL
jgi:uncharacterized membrane protein YfcA